MRHKSHAVLHLLVLAAATACHRQPPQAPSTAPVYGRWLVGMPAWGVETTLEIARRGDTVAATFLGQHGPVRVRNTEIRGATFTMRLHADGEDLAVSGSVSGDTMRGRWYPDHWFKRLVAGGAAMGRRLHARDLAPLAQSTVAWADSVQHVINTQMYDPAPRGAAWDSVWHTTRAAMASATDDGMALAHVSAALARYGQSHLHLDAAPTMSVLPARGGAAASPRVSVTYRRLPNGMALVRIRNFLDESIVARTQLDAAMDSARTAPALIIDLRGNPGGSVVLADHLAAALSPVPVEVGTFVLRRGYERWGRGVVQRLSVDSLPRFAIGDTITAATFFSAIDRLGGAAVYVARGGGARAYRGPVAVLVDRGTASTAEGVAIGLRDAKRAVLVGARTAGALLAAQALPVAPGWQLTVPLADFWSISGERPEGVGIAPDVVVTDARRQANDQALAAAIAALTPLRM